MGRATRGVTGIRFKLEDDFIVSMEVVPGSTDVTGIIPENEDAEIPEVPEENDDNIAESENDADDVEIVDDGRPQLLVVTSGGMGKRSYVEGYRLTRRGAKGVKNVNLRPGEEVIAALRVRHGDELILTTERGMISRMHVDEIRLVGRNSKGVKIMDLRKNDRITGASVVLEVEAPEVPQAEDETQVPVAAETTVDVVTGENQTLETEAVSEDNAPETQE